MNQHTPGPWDIKRGGISWEIVSPSDYVARVYSTSREPDISNDVEGVANARLIAASPDLYAIVRAEYDAHDGFRTLPIGYPAGRAKAICATIAKAEGGAA